MSCLLPTRWTGLDAHRNGRQIQPSEDTTCPGSTPRSGRRGASPGSADGSHLPAASASAEELIAAIGLEPRHAHAGRHIEALQDLSGSRIDAPQIALVAFPGAVPELSVGPGDPGDDPLGLD